MVCKQGGSLRRPGILTKRGADARCASGNERGAGGMDRKTPFVAPHLVCGVRSPQRRLYPRTIVHPGSPGPRCAGTEGDHRPRLRLRAVADRRSQGRGRPQGPTVRTALVVALGRAMDVKNPGRRGRSGATKAGFGGGDLIPEVEPRLLQGLAQLPRAEPMGRPSEALLDRGLVQPELAGAAPERRPRVVLEMVLVLRRGGGGSRRRWSARRRPTSSRS